MSDKDVEQAAQNIVNVLLGRVDAASVGVHINRGEHEDRTRGFNAGYESLPSDPPADDPWRSAYLSGYETGVECRNEHDSGVYDLPEWACPDCFGTGMSGYVAPIDYTDAKTKEPKHSDAAFIETLCPTCGGTGGLPTPATDGAMEGDEG